MNKTLLGIILIGLITVFSLTSTVFASSHNDIKEPFDKGLDFLEAGEYDEAILFFDQVLAIEPNNTEVLFYKGLAFYYLGKYDEAISYYDRVLAIAPNDVDALNNKGIALLERGDYSNALNLFDEGLEIEPTNSLLLRNKIAALASLGLPDAAKLIYDRLTEVDPSFNEPIENIQFGVTSIEKDTSETEKNAQIPDWIRNNAKWWAEGTIGDNDFTSGIQFLIKEGIMQIPETTKDAASQKEPQEIPSWIKNNADWWSQGLISDDDFLKGIEYLAEKGIVNVD